MASPLLGLTAPVVLLFAQGTLKGDPTTSWLDLLPRNAGKGGALLYLQEQLRATGDNVVAAGDGANDIDMFQKVSLTKNIAPLHWLALYAAAPSLRNVYHVWALRHYASSAACRIHCRTRPFCYAVHQMFPAIC